MKNMRIFVVLSIFWVLTGICETASAQPFFYLTNGITVPNGKVTGVALWNFDPYEFNADKFYVDTYNLAMGFGFGLRQVWNGHLKILTELDLCPQRLSKVGQIVAEASTYWEEKLTIESTELSLEGVYSFFDLSKFPIEPYIGLGIRGTFMQIVAADYKPETIKKGGSVLVGGVNIRLKTEPRTGNHVCLKVDYNFVPNIKITTVPGYWRLNAGIQYLWR
ncbi:MAG: hypothetical protein V1681_11395 [Candidatus Neomarinimicrobiota bacterium]